MTSEILDSPKGVPQEILAQLAITGEQATYKANGYLTRHVGMFFRAAKPVFLPLDRPIWQVLVHFQMYDVGPFQVSFLDVDAMTGEIIPLPDDQIARILDRADAFVTAHTPTTAPPF